MCLEVSQDNAKYLVMTRWIEEEHLIFQQVKYFKYIGASINQHNENQLRKPAANKGFYVLEISFELIN